MEEDKCAREHVFKIHPGVTASLALLFLGVLTLTLMVYYRAGMAPLGVPLPPIGATGPQGTVGPAGVCTASVCASSSMIPVTHSVDISYGFTSCNYGGGTGPATLSAVCRLTLIGSRAILAVPALADTTINFESGGCGNTATAPIDAISELTAPYGPPVGYYLTQLCSVTIPGGSMVSPSANALIGIAQLTTNSSGQWIIQYYILGTYATYWFVTQYNSQNNLIVPYLNPSETLDYSCSGWNKCLIGAKSILYGPVTFTWDSAVSVPE